VGYGGSCFPKDVQALERTAHAHGYPARLLEAVEQVNRTQKHKLFELIARHFGNDLQGRTIALWGLAFKPNTDDMREAPSRTLMESLWEAGARVRAFDPEARAETRRIYGEREDLVLCDEAYAALEGADALAVITEWKAFRSPEFDRVRAALNAPVLFDGRNLYDPETVETAGIAYYGIGRGRSLARNGTQA
jgi:UDPglucose 6-dehydrogenase